MREKIFKIKIALLIINDYIKSMKPINKNLTEKQLQPYPVQITMTRAKADLCKLHSVKFLGCPRPFIGSISHFCNYAINKVLLEEIGIKEEYLKSIS